MNVKLNSLVYPALFSGLGLFSYLLLVNYTNMTPQMMEALFSVGAVLFFVVAFNVVGYSLLRLSSWINNQYYYAVHRWKIFAIYTVMSLALLALNYGLLVAAKLLVGAQHPFTFPNGGVRILLVVWLVELVIIGLLIVYKSMKNTLALQHQATELQQENNRASYNALQAQLNPHFLFNSLNTLIAEIEYEPQRAIVFTRNLSEVYRYVLQCQDKPLVRLDQEVDFARAYLFLHQVRLGDCIECNLAIEADYNDSLLPPLTLQLLVENVIKHNTISANRKMTINISATKEYLMVSNSVNLKKTHARSGIGLQNLSKRCQLMMGRDIVIVGDDDTFTVKIPLCYE
ncbi:MAG: histidine kinase [Mucinivorans sp.]